MLAVAAALLGSASQRPPLPPASRAQMGDGHRCWVCFSHLEPDFEPSVALLLLLLLLLLLQLLWLRSALGAP